jgi:hypothetical protein
LSTRQKLLIALATLPRRGTAAEASIASTLIASSRLAFENEGLVLVFISSVALEDPEVAGERVDGPAEQHRALAFTSLSLISAKRTIFLVASSNLFLRNSGKKYGLCSTTKPVLS